MSIRDAHDTLLSTKIKQAILKQDSVGKNKEEKKEQKEKKKKKQKEAQRNDQIRLISHIDGRQNVQQLFNAIWNI